jgi:DNA-binding CsgD family transcriptional regulator
VFNVLDTYTLTPREKAVLERRTKVVTLYHQGESVAEIARQVGMTPQGVYHILRTLQLPTPTERDGEL